MKTLLLSAAALFAAIGVCRSEPPPDQLVKTLMVIIREHCPDATITTNDIFTAKHGTMMFTLHGGLMTGEISPKTYQEEGPNFKGFLLTVGVEKGRYGGQAVVPQELRRPYFSTYISAPATEDGKNHYWIRFSYGGLLDPKLKQAIFAALPGGKFQQVMDANQPIAPQPPSNATH
jgi:hypothetical protein